MSGRPWGGGSDPPPSVRPQKSEHKRREGKKVETSVGIKFGFCGYGSALRQSEGTKEGREGGLRAWAHAQGG